MGIPAERFTSPPADNVLCSVCLDDVLEDPYSLNCGHTFCKTCIDRFQTSSCPTCRKKNAKQTAAPNYSMRNVIGALEVKCQYCVNESDCSSEPAAKRQKVDDNPSKVRVPTWWNAVISRLTGYQIQLVKVGDPSVVGGSSEGETKPSAKRPREGDEETESETTAAGCDWVGKLSEWDAHAKNECQFHPIPCSVPGCNVLCPRKDMKQHMEDRMLKHLDLIASTKVAEECKAIESRFAAKLDAIQRQVAALKNGPAVPAEDTATTLRVADGTNEGPPVQIVVANAGEPIVNGRYDYVQGGERDRVKEGSFMYAKEVTWEGDPAKVYIFRYRDTGDDTTPWYMSVVIEGESLNEADEIDLYVCGVDSSIGGGPEMLPPQTGWEPCGDSLRREPTLQYITAPNA